MPSDSIVRFFPPPFFFVAVVDDDDDDDDDIIDVVNGTARDGRVRQAKRT